MLLAMEDAWRIFLNPPKLCKMEDFLFVFCATPTHQNMTEYSDDG